MWTVMDDRLTWAVDKVGGAGGYWFDGTRRFDGGGFVLPVDPATGTTEPEIYPYCGTPPNLGRACLDLFGDPAGVTFLDMGCGKGRMLALAAEHGFARSVGVELDEGLVACARRNIDAARLRRGATMTRVTVHRGDARQFEFPEEPLALYLNNPFAVPILEVVMANLGESLRRAPRPLTVVLMRRAIEDPANDSPTAELLGATPFLTGGPVPLGGPLRRLLLRGYAVWRFTAR